MEESLKKKIWEISTSLPAFQKDATGFKFKYISLEQIERKLIPLLKKQGIGFNHSTFIVDGENVLQTSVFVLDNPKVIRTVELVIPSNIQLPGMNPYQSLGSGLTYFRRYNLVTIFNIGGVEEDADATTRTSKVAKVDYVKKLKNFIAKGSYDRPQLEGWFNKNRGTMDDAQRSECKGLIENLK